MTCFIVLQFGVVIDAGSSHSEVFVFTWNGEKPMGTGEVKLVHRCFINGEWLEL